MDFSNTNKVLTFEQGCAYTGYAKSYMYKLTSADIIPHSKPNGKTIFFDREKLEAWMLSKPNTSHSEKETAAATCNKWEGCKMIKKALQILSDRAKVFKQAKYAGVPIQFIPDSQYSDRTSNGLTKCCIDWLIFNGHQAERISNQGRVIDNRRRVTDVLGRTGMIGSITRIKSSGTNGTSDISSTINVNGIGRSVKIEAKIGRDVQSEAQRRYQQSIEAAGGVYVIATDFESFYNWYINFVDVTTEKRKRGPI